MHDAMRILVVDDNRDLALNLRDILNEKGYVSAMAGDAESAVAQCRRTPFDLVLMDFKLPGTTGLELQERLSEFIDAEYIIITAHATVQSAAEAVSRRKIVGYETKPLDIPRLLAFIRQIGARRNMEAALRDCDIRNRALLGAIPDMMFRVNREGVFLDVKAEKRDLCVQDVPTIIGLKNRDIAPPEFADLVDEQIRTTLATERIRIFEYRLPVPGRGVRDFEARMVKSGHDEVIAIVRDITDWKRVQQERLDMERRLQMLQRLESLGIMAGGVAHDFNNLLMVVIGNIEMAMAGLPRSSENYLNLEESRKAAFDAADLVKQMLAFSGKGHFVVEPIDLNGVVEEVVQLLHARVPENVTLKMELSGNLPAVESDRSQLRRVIMNLAINAFEAMENRDAGTATIATGVEFCDGEALKKTVADVWMGYDTPLPEGRYVFVEVADQGDGLDNATGERVFEPFFTTKFQGRGLGLAAVIGIVRGHKGFIRLESEVGKGTAFRVLFPESEQVPDLKTEASPPEPAAVRPASGTLMVVDDDDQIRKLLRQRLERQGYEIITAAGGMEALAHYVERRSDIELILMDLSMPEMSGIETFEELCGLGCDIPVVLSSGYSEEEIRPRYADKGFAGFIQKPYQLKTLADMLARLVNRTDSPPD